MNYQSTNEEDPLYLSNISGVLADIKNQLNELNITPELVQMTKTASGTIYELKQIQNSKTVESFDFQQSEQYIQNTDYFKQFFGGVDDDILLVVDGSNLYSNSTKLLIQQTA